jgi:hypothetical protein
MESNETSSLTALIEGIIDDVGLLFRQEVALAQSEVRQEWNKTKRAATALSWGMMVFAVGSIFVGQMLVHFLNWLTGLHMWVCCGIMGGICFLIGAALYEAGRRWAGQVSFLPRQTLLSIKDNVQWMKTLK